MIPKLIHYCWFGEKSIPEKDIECINSWRRYCPDYKICIWNESNYNIKKNKYMYDAYKCQKWGFVPDYARLDIIYNFGGIYLDTDVEIIRPLDFLLNYKGFMGFEHNNYVNLGLGFGAEKGSKIVFEIMKEYDNISFYNRDGSINLTPSPILNTRVLERMGLIRDNIIQQIEDITIFPKEYLCPLDYNTGALTITENTVSIHHYHASWVSQEEIDILRRSRSIKKIVGEEKGEKIARIINFPFRVKMHYKKDGIKKTIIFYLKKIESFVKL